ncbi:HD domain-containing phosphohydrolase [Niallia sp. JL1B1071]|uniref:HD domain-containing phosphohydrolase n=1 Tax=Niallia tiangongensis TaxID=3237105 RepID=UPI0037DD8DDB
MNTSLVLQAKILIVDDNLSNVLLLEKMLKLAGYSNIRKTTDSREVLSIYLEYQPDVVLLDLRMPYLSGFQVMEKLKDIARTDILPIIVISAQNDDENKNQALQWGARDFILKPFSKTELLIRIHNMLEVRLLNKQLSEYNNLLEQKVRESTRELQESYMELIKRLGIAAEIRDKDTGNHIMRIGLYTRVLARKLGFSKDESELIMHASSLHDIGKIGVRDEILLKPGRLSASEWVEMKMHTVTGANILSGSSSKILKMAEEIALTHHEKWDGTGYPNGLKGDQIPLIGQITSICDIFDALLSDRPYKEAWSVEEAVKEIKNGAGSHFNPNLVKAFISILPEILEINRNYVNVLVKDEKIQENDIEIIVKGW